MAKFKEFTTLEGDPIIINFDNVTAIHLKVIRRGDTQERIETVISLVSGGRAVVKESINDVREWLMGTIS